MNSNSEARPSPDEERKTYGSIAGKKPFAVGSPNSVGAVYELEFTGGHLDRLMEGIRDFGIVPDDEFFMDAIMAAIDAREAELGGEKIVDPERERKIEAALQRQAEWRREIAQQRRDGAVQSAD